MPFSTDTPEPPATLAGAVSARGCDSALFIPRSTSNEAARGQRVPPATDAPQRPISGLTPSLNVAIEIPENVSAPLRSRWKDVPRGVLEAAAAEAYCSGAFTAHQGGEWLGHGSRWETESFLKRAQANLHYSDDDLESDLATLRAARG